MKQYIYKDKIGSGNYASVYRANNILTRETVAIKKINKSKLPNGLISRFSKEIEILKLINHINIIKLKDYFIDDKYIYIITEYCNRGSLKEQIGLIKNEIDVRHIVKQIIHGIQYLDDVGIMHRDIKPDNILLNNDNVIKIIDFGFSVEVKESDLYSTICGTPLYMSPELLQSKEYSKSSDLWSIGIISYELFHYVHPFGTPKNIVELLENIKNNKILYKYNISYHFLQFIDSLLQLQPSSRPKLSALNLHPWFLTVLCKYDLNNDDELFHMDDFYIDTHNKLITKEQYENNNNSSDIEEFENIELTESIINELPKTQPINISDRYREPYEKLQTVDYMSPISPRFISNKIINYSTRVIKNITGYTY
jgi:non-specific serine/threonine protein kinase